MVEYLLHALVLTSATMTGDLVTHALSDLGIASGTEPSFVDFLVDPRHPANHARRTLEAIHNALVEERVRGDEVHAVAELATACAEAIVLAAPSDLDRTRQLFDDLTAGGVAWSRPIGLPLETLLDDVSAMALFRPFHDAARASGATVRGQVWQASVPDTVAIEFVRLAAPRVVDPRQLVAALRSGYAASDLLPNAAGTDALRRLRQRAPVTEQLAHAMKALLTVYEAGRAWRSWVGS
jgi:hypothetical protein